MGDAKARRRGKWRYFSALWFSSKFTTFHLTFSCFICIYPFARPVSYCTYHVSVFCVLNEFDKEIFTFASWPRPSPLLSTAINDSSLVLIYVRALLSSNDISPLSISQLYHLHVLTWRILFITYVLEPPMN